MRSFQQQLQALAEKPSSRPVKLNSAVERIARSSCETHVTLKNQKVIKCQKKNLKTS
jgi:hypothetical protein